jgi:hypothetical protein
VQFLISGLGFSVLFDRIWHLRGLSLELAFALVGHPETMAKTGGGQLNYGLNWVVSAIILPCPFGKRA